MGAREGGNGAGDSAGLAVRSGRTALNFRLQVRGPMD